MLLKLYLYPSVFGGALYLLVVCIFAPLRRFIHNRKR
jgi:hypothetical protein